jgi:hypothetical protein
LHRQVWIVLPPIQSNLLGFIDRTDQQPDPDGQQFHIGQRYPDVTRDHQTFIQNPIKNID